MHNSDNISDQPPSEKDDLLEQEVIFIQYHSFIVLITTIL